MTVYFTRNVYQAHFGWYHNALILGPWLIRFQRHF